MHQSINLLGDICDNIKKEKKIHITCGGHFVTAGYQSILERFPNLDSVVRGEGEYTLLELAQKILNEEEWRQVPGLAFKHEGKICLSQARELIENLDELPFPARDFLDRKIAKGEQIDTIYIYSSRGCYGVCNYCSIKAFYGPVWRGRSAENIVDEIEYLNKKYNPKKFMFTDDNFMGSGKKGKTRVLEIAREIIRRNLNIKIIISCRVNDVDPKVFSLLIKAGLVEVYMGVESFSQSELDYFNKNVRTEDIYRAIEFLQNKKIFISAGFIMFTPYTKLEDITDNIKFLKKYNMLDIGKFNYLERFIGSAFDRDTTPGIHKDGYDIFKVGSCCKVPFNFFDLKTKKLFDLMVKDHWQLKAYVILERCKRFAMMKSAFIRNDAYKYYSKYVKLIERKSIEIDTAYITNIISILNNYRMEEWDNKIGEIRSDWMEKNNAIRSFLRKIERLFKTSNPTLNFSFNPEVQILRKKENVIYLQPLTGNTIEVDKNFHALVDNICNPESIEGDNDVRIKFNIDEFREFFEMLLKKDIIKLKGHQIPEWRDILMLFSTKQAL